MSFNIWDFQNGGATLTVGAASSSATLPANNSGQSQTYGVSCTGNAHFRIGKGAQTATATDPMIVGLGGVVFINAPAGSDTVAAIQEGSASVMIVWRVMEG